MTADEIAALRWYVVDAGDCADADIDDADGNFVGAFPRRDHAQLSATSPALFAALRDLRKWCIPGMNWTDEIGQLLLANADAAMAEAMRVDTTDGSDQGDAPCP